MATELHQLLADLVAIPSMNPMGLHELGDGYGEAEIADFVEDFCRKCRIPCERQQVSPGRDNIVAVVEGERKDGIVLEAHMDTVPTARMDIEPFTPDVKDGRLYGRGSCDTKASLAAMLIAVKRAAERGNLPQSICVAATADEEFGFTGVMRAIELGIDARMGVVGEPTQLQTVVAHKGCLRWEIVTRGKAAHGSRPEEGENAIYRMAPALAALERYAAALAAEPGHPLAGGKTLNVGVIQGGQSVNIVPDRCTIQVDRRTLPDEDPMAAYDALKSFLHAELGADASDLCLPPFLFSPGLDVPPDAEVVESLKAACAHAGLRSEIQGVSYGTDASKLTKAGIPSIVFGPGDIANAHSAVEFVELAQVDAAASVLEKMVAG